MDWEQFREQHSGLTALEDRAPHLLAYAEDAMQSYPDALRPLLASLRTECEAAQRLVEVGLCDRLLGWLAFDRSDYDEALARFETSLACFDRAGDRGGRLKSLNGIASAQSELGHLEAALEVFREALELAEALGDAVQTMILRPNLGETLVQLHQYQEADPYFRSALDSGLLSPLNEALVLSQWGRSLMAQRRFDESEERLRCSVERARRGAYLPTLATALDALGELGILRGPDSQTAPLLEEARSVARLAGDRSAEVRATVNLGRLTLSEGHPAEALVWFRDALEVCRTISSPLQEAEVWKWTAAGKKALEQWKDALEAQERFQALTLQLHGEEVSRQVAQFRADQARRETILLKEQTRVLTLLGDLGQRITSSLDVETIVLTVYESIGGLLKAETFGLGLYDAERSLIDYRLFIENGVRIPRFEASSDAETFSAWSIRHGQDLLLGDVEAEYRRYIPALSFHFGDETRHSRSCLYTPLKANGRTIGVLSAQSYSVNAYDERDLATFKTLAASIAIAIQNAQLFERINVLATVDALTGAATRRHLFERTEEEFQRFLRDGSALSLVMIDLDNFKALNDSWGHAEGDRLLAAFGVLCLGHKRPHDLFGRYGGEEFALLLCGTELEGAVRSAERLCREVAHLGLVTASGHRLTITASFGVTEFDRRDADITRVFHRADEALYEAKQSGRNRVVSRLTQS